ALIDNGAGAGRTFLSLKPKSRLRDAFDGGVDIGIGVDDDGIFASHFKDGALDPDLAGGLRGGSFVDVESDFARAGEGDVARLRVRDDRIAEACAGAGAEVHYAFGHAGFF